MRYKILNHTFTEDISIINKNIEQKYDIYEKHNWQFINNLIMGKHNRLSEDNIIRKIKARFHEKLRLYINIE